MARSCKSSRKGAKTYRRTLFIFLPRWMNLWVSCNTIHLEYAGHEKMRLQAWRTHECVPRRESPETLARLFLWLGFNLKTVALPPGKISSPCNCARTNG